MKTWSFSGRSTAVSSRRTKDDEDDAVFVDAQQSTLMAWCLMERRRLARGGVVGTYMQHLRSPKSGKKPKKLNLLLLALWLWACWLLAFAFAASFGR